MKKILYCCVLIAQLSFGQNIGIGTTVPHNSAALDISSNNKGFLMPRLTSTQRNSIISPAKGMMVYDSSRNNYWYYNGNAWREVAGNLYNNDSSLVVGTQTTALNSYNISNANVTDSSGYLYDSGGPSGDYGNNENYNFYVFNNGNQLAVDITVISFDTESPYDSLKISDSYNHQYILHGTATGTFRLYGYARFTFFSNGVNTRPGFKLRWDKIYSSNANNYTAQLAGWYFNPAKLYMRGGANINNYWSPDSSGRYSFSYGFSSKASGENSISLGYLTKATGFGSIAIGYDAQATDDAAVSIGASTVASGNSSTALGIATVSSGLSAIATGNTTKASGGFSTAMGALTVASGDASTALGFGTRSKSYGGTVLGLYNDSTNAINPVGTNPQNRIFEIGNGLNNGTRSNALTVLQNGNSGFGTTTPQARLHVKDSSVLFSGALNLPVIPGDPPSTGAGSRMMWYPDKAAFRTGRVSSTEWDKDKTGDYSFASGYGPVANGSSSGAIGYFADALGNFSFATGYLSTASGEGSTALGYGATAQGVGSVAMGFFTRASGFGSTTMGHSTIAFGQNSTAMGYGVRVKSYGGTAVGIYNDTLDISNPDLYGGVTRVFQVGNGLDNSTRSNALTILHNGNVGINVTLPSAKLELRGTLRFSSTVKKWDMAYDSTNNYFYIDEFGAGRRLYIKDGGNVGINNSNPSESLDVIGNTKLSGTLTVQNGKGIIRNTDGTQSKKLSASVTVNASIGAGLTSTFNITWPETFSSTPEAFVGNVTGGAGGWAEVVMTIANVTTSGATLYVYNPKAGSVSPSYTVRIIAIGAQ